MRTIRNSPNRRLKFTLDLMLERQKDEVKRLILAYLAIHPQASDTREGIRQWWLVGKGIDLSVIARALTELVAEGRLSEWSSSDGGVHYSLPNAPRARSVSHLHKNNGRH